MLPTTPAAWLPAATVSTPITRRQPARAAAAVVWSGRAAAVVAVIAAATLLPNLGGPAFWDEDEPLNAACSLAMWQTGDWVVPTFNGRLRVEKPPLVNWLQLAGFLVAGTDETGARLASAMVTIGTCLLTWRLGALLFGPAVGIWSGVVMATAVWTTVAGRAATPDAALGFCTTLALVFFASGQRQAARDGAAGLPIGAAAAVGAACGLAMLAKGPVGLVLPLAALFLHAGWTTLAGGFREDGSGRRKAVSVVRSCCSGVRPLMILLAALAVAAPWYVAVSIRTSGAWPREFFLVHNAGRFTGTMEGHSGSAVLYYPLVLLVGMFPWSCGWIPVVGRVVAGVRGTDGGGMRLLVAWAAVWIGVFSLSATKLPGYIWPVYPAIAVMVGSFLANWTARTADADGAGDARGDRWMRLGWISLVAAGVAIAVGLARLVPHQPAVAAGGLAPIVGGTVSWLMQSRGGRLWACRCWAATGAVTVLALAGVVADAIGGTGGSRDLVAGLAAESPRRPLAAVSPPPSVAFYAGRLLGGPLPVVDGAAGAATFFAAHPDGRLIVDADRLADIAAAAPAGWRVLAEATTPLRPRRLLVLAVPAPADPPTNDSRPDIAASPEGT